MLRQAARSLWRTGATRSICSSSAALQEGVEQSKEVRMLLQPGADRPCRKTAPRRPPGWHSEKLVTHLPPWPLQEFLNRFAPHAGTLNPPEFPSNFLPKAAAAAEGTAAIPDKLSFNFFVPHQTLCQSEKVSLHDGRR